jgi:hypothetical protein
LFAPDAIAKLCYPDHFFLGSLSQSFKQQGLTISGKRIEYLTVSAFPIYFR